MTKKTRYALLAVFCLFFLIAAPLIVLYVRGVTYDFTAKKFVQTGLLSLRAEPSDVQVFLNGKLRERKAADINFLVPDEYQLTLKKTGYNDWTKRLNVNPGQVTWANPANNNIYLLLNSPKSKSLDSGVLDFYYRDNFLLYLSDGVLSVTKSGSTQAYPLPQPAGQILANNGGDNFILTGSPSSSKSSLLFFDAASGNFSDLSGLFVNTPVFKFSGGGGLFALSDEGLYQVDAEQKTKNLIFPQTKAFAFQDNNLYYIQETNNLLTLNVSQPPFTQSQTLLDNVPEFSSGDLMVTFGKQILLLADGTLYQANNAMQKVADNITQSSFAPDEGLITIFHSGEFDSFDPSGQNLNFITRSSADLSNLEIKTNIDYAFYSNHNGINAIELDPRGGQNQYNLYPSQNIQKFILDGSGQNIFFLENGDLKSITIR